MVSVQWGGAAGVMGRGWVFLAPVALLLLAFSTRGTAALPAADAAPVVAAVYPPPEMVGVPLGAARDGSVAVSFSEPVSLAAEAVELACERSQLHALAVTGGPAAFSFASDRPFLPGEWCVGSVRAERVADLDGDDPPDALPSNFTWRFRAAAEPVVINELDTVSPGGAGDFIELYDGGRGNTDLSGLTVVLYRGDEASVYAAAALDGLRTDGAGYFVLGASGVAGADLRLADDALRDGPDAVALYDAPKAEFPRNAPVALEDLLDALVYGPADGGLLVLLAAGQAALDEAARGAAAADSSQRCPNGRGEPRETEAFIQSNPTPGAVNECRVDAPPAVTTVSPRPGDTGVAVDVELAVVFSEPVTPGPRPLEVACGRSGSHDYHLSGEGREYGIALDDPLAYGESCTVTVLADQIRDVDTDDPPDNPGSNYSWSFQTVRWVADNVLINEVDADTSGIDAAEFIELYDGGAGNTALEGLAVVLFNGADDRSYLAVSLDEYRTNQAGYFVIGNAGVAGIGLELAKGALQNGPDAVVLVAGQAADFPNGTPVATVAPIDAVVYSRPSQNDPGLQPLLNTGQPQVDEAARGEAEAHSNQRCPNGAGGPRNTTSYKQNTPTPGTVNQCVTDVAPDVAEFSPPRGAVGVSISAPITVGFSEPVNVSGKWMTVKCGSTGTHTHKTTGGPELFTMMMDLPFAYEESCTVTLNSALITDQDSDDPPNELARNVSWSFTTGGAPAEFVLINEIDADTPSTDAAEFIELYDGGRGRTALDGLTIVLFNGSTNGTYRAVDLDGFNTDERGYFVIGNPSVSPDLALSDGAIQNGPDAIALYAADATQFPADAPVTLQGLLDAIVYGEPDGAPPELLKLLTAGQSAVDEGGRGAADLHSLQRCPNGQGGQRQTTGFRANAPTPGQTSLCLADEPPSIMQTYPTQGATGIPLLGAIIVEFSEPVALTGSAANLACGAQGHQTLAIGGGPAIFTFSATAPLPPSTSCRFTILSAGVSDVDADDPPDNPATDFELAFTTGAAAPDHIIINEVDADTPGSDTAEFIELYDGGRGHTDLTGLVIVLFNGSDERSYRAVDLAGAQTDRNGYAVIGNKGVAGVTLELPAGFLQNGADAAALFAGSVAAFPNGTTLHTQGLLDALVYGTSDPTDAGLLALLEDGQAQVDEGGGGTADLHSVGRCPNGEGGQRRTASYRTANPTPAAANDCAVVADSAPAIIRVEPEDGGTNIPLDSDIRITFSEAVQVESTWFTIECDGSGAHSATVGGDSVAIVLRPDEPFLPGESCAVRIESELVTDVDTHDPPDEMASDYSSSFSTVISTPALVLINEVDADTPGSDTAEFIELYDGGDGETSLDGLVMVWWNGKTDSAYRTIDLSGQVTDGRGFFVVGNPDLDPDLSFGRGALQNGPDAVAIYAGRVADFPSGLPLTTTGLIDAVVYGSSDAGDDELLSLLLAGEPQVDEDAQGKVEAHSLQRCPDGGHGPRRTAGFRAGGPSPGQANRCALADEPPAIASVYPADGSLNVPLGVSVVITFTEDVTLSGQWYSLVCDASGNHAADVTGGPRTVELAPRTPFSPGERCGVTIIAPAVHDSDTNDPPDALPVDYAWAFNTAETEPPGPPVAGFLFSGPIWIGETAVFTNTSRGPGPLTYAWDFGDGAPVETAAHPTHLYDRMGTYTVSLTVTGPTGSAGLTQTIDVRPRRLYVGIVMR